MQERYSGNRGDAVMLFPLYPLLNSKASAGGIAIVIFCLAITGLLLWILYGTRSRIDETHITFKSCPINGKIAIDKIHTILSGKNLYAGFRPATAPGGIVMKYGNMMKSILVRTPMKHL